MTKYPEQLHLPGVEPDELDREIQAFLTDVDRRFETQLNRPFPQTPNWRDKDFSETAVLADRAEPLLSPNLQSVEQITNYIQADLPEHLRQATDAVKQRVRSATVRASSGLSEAKPEVGSIAKGVVDEIKGGAIATTSALHSLYTSVRDPEVRQEGAARLRSDIDELKSGARDLIDEAQITPRKAVAGLTLAALAPLAIHGLVNGRDQDSIVDGGTAPEFISSIKVDYENGQTLVTVPELSDVEQDPSMSVADVQGFLVDEHGNIPGVRLEDGVLIVDAVVNEDQARAAGAMSVLLPEQIPAETEETVAPVSPASLAAPTAPESLAQPEAPTKSPEEMTDEEYMDWLVSQVQVTAEDYRNFEVDESYAGIFDDELSGRRIKPTAFVLHWTAGRYQNGVEQFVSAIKGRDGNCCNVMYFIDDDNDPNVYRFTRYWDETSHARGANDYTQGVEIEADGLRGEGGYTPEQLEKAVMLAYRFMDAADIEIARKNFLAHSEITEGKIDPPAYLMDRLFPVLEKLANELRGTSNIDIQMTVEGTDPEKNYENALNALLDYIASKEGDWNSINRGDAGDTPLHEEWGRAAYREIFGERMLTDVTIDEIMQLQRQGRIKAVGKFQLVPDTLEAAVRATGIDTTRKYDEEAQLELAVDYLILGRKQPALTKYITGESDDLEAAIEGLCAEWASMVCNDAEGRWDGIAGNDAKGGQQQLSEQKALLQELREAYIALHEPGSVVSETTTTTTATSVPAQTTTTVEVGAQPPESESEHSESQGVYVNEDFVRDLFSQLFNSREAFDEWFNGLDRQQGEDGSTKVRVSFMEMPTIG